MGDGVVRKVRLHFLAQHNTRCVKLTFSDLLTARSSTPGPGMNGPKSPRALCLMNMGIDTRYHA
jgi:hypothetical protein